MYKIRDEINIFVKRKETNFDRACEEAYYQACKKFGVDDCGNCNNIQDWDCSTDMIVIKFQRYEHYATTIGHNYIYHFYAHAQRNEE